MDFLSSGGFPSEILLFLAPVSCNTKRTSTFIIIVSDCQKRRRLSARFKRNIPLEGTAELQKVKNIFSTTMTITKLILIPENCRFNGHGTLITNSSLDNGAKLASGIWQHFCIKARKVREPDGESEKKRGERRA